MKHEIFERVEQLVTTLSNAEKDVLHKHLTSTLPEWQTKSKLVDLLEHLQSREEDNDSAYSRKNYQMLEDRILDSLLFDINLNRNGKQCEDNGLLCLRKEGLKMRILQQRGMLHRAYRLAETVKQQAMREEDFDEIIEALNLQLSMIGLQQDATRFRELTEQINHYEYCRFAKRKSLALLYELKMKKHHGMTENLDLFVKDSIMTLQRYLDRIQCRTIEFIKGYFIKEDFELEANWREAHYYMTRLYESAAELPGNTPHFDFWELVYEQGRLCLKINEGETGLFLLQKCIQKLPAEHLARQQALKLIFQHHYHHKNYQEALELIAGYEKTRFYQLHLSDSCRHHWNFRKACTFFQLCDSKMTRTCLDETREFEKASMQNNLQVRFLKIMLAIDSQHPDLADNYIGSLRKLVSRNQWLDAMKAEGLDTFYYALFKLRNTGFRFSGFYREYPETVSCLKKTDRHFQSGEEKPLISYWEWLKRKPAHDAVKVRQKVS